MLRRARPALRPGLALCCFLVVLAAPPSDADVDPRPVLAEWVLERTTSSETVLAVDAFVVSRGSVPSLFLSMGLEGGRTGTDGVELLLFAGQRGEIVPSVYGDGRVFGCASLGPTSPPHPCSAYGQSLQMIKIRANEASGPRLHDRILIVGRGADVDLKLLSESRGWRLRRLPPAVRFIRAEESGAVGFGSLDGSLESFSGTSRLRGGPRGSVAVANLPCTRPAGIGRVTFVGGSEPVEMTCPTGPLASFTNSQTQWQLRGHAVGGSSTPYRLIVVDLPE